MRRAFLITACLVALPLLAAAQTYTASLTADAVVPDPGPAGATGFATVSFSATDAAYSILVSGVGGLTAAHIHQGAAGASGPIVVDFAAAFTGGSASGSVEVDADTADAILADPAGYYVQVHSSEFPAGAVRGQLGTTSGGAGVTLYLPVVATVAGQAGTDFHTDGRIVNRSGSTANLTLDFFRQVSGGVSEPTATTTLEIAPNEQAVLDDLATELFDVTNGSGAVRITSDQMVSASARIYNDQRDAGDGTFGQYAIGQPASAALSAGNIAFLSNEDAGTGEGYRSNIGWFNPNDFPVDVVLSAWDASGDHLGEVSRTLGGYEQFQRNLGQLWPALATYGNLYVTFTADAPVFFYGSVVDNVNGDAIYVPATN